jgi:hypothetical protein
VIRDHVGFLNAHVQPFYESENFAINWFFKEMEKAVLNKLLADLKKNIELPHLLSHVINEVVQFEHSLGKMFGKFYLEKAIDIARKILNDSNILVKWLEVEKNFAFERMDDILNSENSWDLRMCRDDSCDKTDIFTVPGYEYSYPKLIDSFIGLLEATTDRFRFLAIRNVQEEFINGIQKPLIDRFIKWANEQEFSESKLLENTCLLLNGIFKLFNNLKAYETEDVTKRIER